ncbi:MAG: peptide ABC transporter substrate-binding protein [Anaerolineae bacterium]|nr:peptide ABC transporter substrate-binding protein [Anaerolineae bacterium]
MQRLIQSVRLLVLIALISFSSSSVVRTVTAAPPQQESQTTLRVAMPFRTDLDPVAVSRFDPYTRDLVENLFVGLTRYDPLTHQVEPMLAESWSVSENGLTWTFTLREDVNWVRYDPDGQTVVSVRPVTAGDFVFAIQRACDPSRPSPVTSNLMIINGCETVAKAFPEVIDDLFIAREIGVRAVGLYTLEIDVLFPSSYFLSLTSTPEFRPLPREAVAAADNWTQPDTIITNGPFVLQTATQSGMALGRNTLWPDPVTGNIDQVDITFTTETKTASMLASSSQIDLARLEAGDIGTAQAANPDLIQVAEGTSLIMMGFSFDRALVDQPEIRRALSQAIDREALVNQFFPNQALPVAQFTPAGVVAAPEFNNLAFDPIQAQANYSAAGFAGCENVPEKLIILVPDDDPIWSDVAQAVTQQWSDNLGCFPTLFEVRTLPRVLMIELGHSAYDPETVTRSHLWLAMWSADYPDANAWLGDALHCRYGYIKPGRLCDKADTRMDDAALETDTTKRAELYSEAEAFFFGSDGSFPVTPLFFMSSTWLQQPWVSEVNRAGPARYDLWNVDPESQAG